MQGAFGRLIARHPLLYHMAEPGGWEAIRRHGLLSTTALLDLYGLSGAERATIEARRRPAGVVLRDDRLGEAVIRDQMPMDDASLSRCLRDGLTPEDWYRILNGKVFFWPAWQRLRRLMNAKTYRERAHDVLVVDTASLIKVHGDRMWLSAINSGWSRRFAQPRGKDTFRRIEAWMERTGPSQRSHAVAEVAVDYAVPDIERFVTRVLRMKADEPDVPLETHNGRLHRG